MKLHIAIVCITTVMHGISCMELEADYKKKRFVPHHNTATVIHTLHNATKLIVPFLLPMGVAAQHNNITGIIPTDHTNILSDIDWLPIGTLSIVALFGCCIVGCAKYLETKERKPLAALRAEPNGGPRYNTIGINSGNQNFV